MNVQSSARRRALLDIYQAHHKGRSGVLSLRQIERDWKQTGLRHADLELAIKNLIQQQLLLPKPVHEGMAYELTYLGECAMQFLTAGGVLTTLRDWFILRRARLRQRDSVTPASTPHNRRAEDRNADADSVSTERK